MIIAVDGINGVGKSTLAKKIALNLVKEKYNAKYASLPGADYISVCTGIRTILNSNKVKNPFTKLYLYLADMAEFYENHDPDKIYIMDRSYISTLVYQSLSGIPVGFIQECIERSGFFLDHTIFLTCEPEVAKKRTDSRKNKKTGNPGGYANLDLDFYKKAQARYEHIVENVLDLKYDHLDTTELDEDEVFEITYSMIRDIL